MFRVKNNTIPEEFVNKFAIPSRGPRPWNSLTDKYIKTITSIPLFKRRYKNHLIKIKNITNYF